MCYPDRVNALQARILSSPGNFKQQPNCKFAVHQEENANRYRAKYSRKHLSVDVYMTLFQHTHRLHTRGRPCAHAVFKLIKQRGAVVSSTAERNLSDVRVSNTLSAAAMNFDTLEI